MIKVDHDDVWEWYHHLENAKNMGLSKADYCNRYGLNKIKFGNIKYIFNYCNSASPERFKKMMEFVDKRDSSDSSDLSLSDFCKANRIKKDDFYTACKHREYKYSVLKRIAENHPVPELKEPELKIEALSAPVGLLSKKKLYEKESAPQAEEQPEVVEEKPLTFIALNTNPGASSAVNPKDGQVGEGAWSDAAIPASVHIEPEIHLKGNRIELTFTKTVRLTATPDTPHQKLLDIITLLKDL